MIIVRTRVQETCVLIVTNPEANAAKAQNALLSTAALGSSTSTEDSLTEADVVRRCKKIAVTPTTTLIAAATVIVLRTPRTGSNTNPAARVPMIAPARLHA